jgi:uncharacterized membrane protein
MKPLKNEWLQLLILAGPFCVVALLWDKLPAQIPIHWGIHGQVNGYTGKVFGTLFMPILNVFLALLLGALPFLDSRFRKYDDETKASTFRVMKFFRLIITLFNACFALAILAFALHYRFDMVRGIVSASGLLFIIVGNFLGKLRPNTFSGIRTPWTLASRTVWLKTHRVGGHIMVAGGICMLFGSFLMPGAESFFWCFIPVFILMMAIPIIYSYVCFRAKKDAHPAA